MSGAVRHDVPLAALTTLRLGGPARDLRTATTTDELVAAVRDADATATDLLLVAGGSNLVVADAGSPAPWCTSPPAASALRRTATPCSSPSPRASAGRTWSPMR